MVTNIMKFRDLKYCLFGLSLSLSFLLPLGVEAAVKIISIVPNDIILQSGETVTLSVKGTGLKTIRSGALYRDKTGKQEAGRLNVHYLGSISGGRLTLKLLSQTHSGNYFLGITDSQRKTVILPIRVSVTIKKTIAKQSFKSQTAQLNTRQTHASVTSRTTTNQIKPITINPQTSLKKIKASSLTVTSISQRAVKFHAGQTVTLTIHGSALNTIQRGGLYTDNAGTIRASVLNVRYIGSPTSGRLTLVAPRQIKAGNYYIQLADSHGKHIILPVKAIIVTTKPAAKLSKATMLPQSKSQKNPVLTKLKRLNRDISVITKTASPQNAVKTPAGTLTGKILKVTSARPQTVNLISGRSVILSIQGTGLNTIKQGALYTDKTGKLRAGSVTVRYTGSPTFGRLALIFKGKAKPGNYYIQLAGSRGKKTMLPVKAIIQAVKSEQAKQISAVGKVPVTVRSKPAVSVPMTTKPVRTPQDITLVQKNQAPLVTDIQVPQNIKPGQTFIATITATDDFGVTAVLVKFGRQRQTSGAKHPFKKAETFRIRLTAPKSGEQVLTAIAIDTQQLKSISKEITIKLVERGRAVKPPSVTTTNYSWDTGSWGTCSRSCGGGTQNRVVQCKGNDGTTGTDNLCSGTKPNNIQACNTQSCPATEPTNGTDSQANESRPVTSPAVQLKKLSVISAPLSQGNFIAGDMITLEVELEHPDPTNIVRVSLSCSCGLYSDLIEVPEIINIPSGQTRMRFQVQTNRQQGMVGSSVSSAFIQAEYQGKTVNSQPLRFFLNAGIVQGDIAINEVSHPKKGQPGPLGPAGYTGGKPFEMSISLSSTSEQPVQIALSSDKPNILQVPGNVTIPANERTVSIQLHSVPVKNDEYVKVTASYNGQSKDATIRIMIPPIETVSLPSERVTGGDTVTGRISLGGSAPEEGVTINLTNESPEIASLPNSVVIPAGQDSVNFSIQTQSVSNKRWLGIKAESGSRWNQKTGGAWIMPPARLTSVQRYVPDNFKPGNTILGTVIIKDIAPAAGVVVTLSSNKSQVEIPASVTIPPGKDRMTFNINTQAVTETTFATITASYGGVNKYTSVVLRPLLSAVTIEPVSNTHATVGGEILQGKVHLAWAPVSSTTIVLTSNSSKVTLPQSVTIPAGQSTALFTINTQVVAQQSDVTITGSLQGASTSVTLTLINQQEAQAIAEGSQPPVLSNLILPLSIEGGHSVTARVELNKVASSDFVVTLTKTAGSTVQIPDFVTIPSGRSKESFIIATTAGNQSETLTITASNNTTTLTRPLVVQPSYWLLKDIKLSNSRIEGGRELTVTISTDRPTNKDGDVILLSSSDQAILVVPESVNILPGNDHVTFNVRPNTVNEQTSVTITARLEEVVRSAVLEVLPQR